MWPLRPLTELIPLYHQIYFKNQQAATGQSHPKHLPLSDVLQIVIDSFTSATERHIEVCTKSPHVIRAGGLLKPTFDRSVTVSKSLLSSPMAGPLKDWRVFTVSRNSQQVATVTVCSSSGANSRRTRSLLCTRIPGMQSTADRLLSS